ncbi:MAG: amino acid permease [Cylindrospermopsis raciborskii KL1]|jgi:APA family basic amino acid/polyamine antiporter|uniref:Amino acid permease n=1 Tax=Cylindrospermopsis raciborskii CENA303 TaxID=1170769 RepID=A0A1X4GC11_9CYAN|nr:APC family permease [Cylindrospermopsis raciborskii]MBG0743600.1 amino acid permease [Cylindrospermopsis raciborskii KL1]MCZ2201412.1 APC family permease [Cylindrospermopsis raciborskii PAMP2012]MCZ2205122.1 APC family permease [Cylindrospermopsis raciborskii PAMP2011]NLQ06583.1 amino acid permease [Cylindrospermopsis raciborskii MVCC19]OHY34334.1 amino acid permease [Cylindrospermopsis raciborskii MVCC14]
MSNENTHSQLKRELDWISAAFMGLASVIGAGIFISIGVAAEISGSMALLALVVAGLLGFCNSFNLAQLSVSHPVSGGIYEYGYKYLTPWLGFTGGWIYLLSKTAVAATAALGFSGYLINNLGIVDEGILVPVAEISVFIITLIVFGGMRSSKVSTIVVVLITITSLLCLITVGLFFCFSHGWEKLTFSSSGINSYHGTISFLQSVALMFVSYNGAARISMVSEEIVDPKKSIPRAIIFTIVTTMALYIGVSLVSFGSIGPEAFASATRTTAAPLKAVADSFGIPLVSNLLALGATTSMLSILLTTVLGVSRLLLAMGRRGDMPKFLTKLNTAGTTPEFAVIFVGIAIAVLVLVGDVKITWSFGTFGALYRSFITSLSALQIGDQERLYPKWISWFSLCSSVVLAFCIEWYYWVIGLGLILVGLVWRFTFRQFQNAKNIQLIPKE